MYMCNTLNDANLRARDFTRLLARLSIRPQFIIYIYIYIYAVYSLHTYYIGSAFIITPRPIPFITYSHRTRPLYKYTAGGA